MAWMFAVVALGLVMATLTLVELRQPVRAMTVGDRVIGAQHVHTRDCQRAGLARGPNTPVANRCIAARP